MRLIGQCEDMGQGKERKGIDSVGSAKDLASQTADRYIYEGETAAEQPEPTPNEQDTGVYRF
jgi:hypothetical protein